MASSRVWWEASLLDGALCEIETDACTAAHLGPHDALSLQPDSAQRKHVSLREDACVRGTGDARPSPLTRVPDCHTMAFSTAFSLSE